MDPSRTERFHISLKTPAGELSTSVEVPMNFIPVTAIVPLTRRLGEEATALEEAQIRDAGQQVSCQKGCAACCRMLVPMSPPEAFALKAMVDALPDERRKILLDRLSQSRARLQETGILARLTAVVDTEHPPTDEAMEPINRDYYALRMACPFLEDETCSIYEDRPAACRELLVTTPAAFCDDLVNNPVRPLPTPMRVSTVLALLWSELKGTAPTLIPLPMALDWAEQHARDGQGTWSGTELLEHMLENVWRMLEQEFANRAASQAAPKP